jgi:hypothetical protein
MSTLKEKIQKNKSKFQTTNEKYGIFTEELLEFLGEDLFTAPATNLKSMYNAYPGGLVDHIINVTKYALNINNSLPDNLKVNKESLIKVCFLHQIGKVYLFKLCTSDWHIENQGKMYDFNEDIVAMHISERSAYYALTYGVSLSENEYQAILNYDKPDADKQAKWHSCTLSTIIKQANELAIIEEKSTNNG